MKWVLWIMLLASVTASAHEMTPAYPTLNSSFVDGVKQTQVLLFNKREDVHYYEIGVFDSDWRPVTFATGYKVVKLSYLSKLYIDIYMSDSDAKRALYICSISKLRGESKRGTLVSSRICSKIKR